MEAKHLTKDPVIYTVVVALIFLFTSALFLAYDLFVNRRQRLVKQRALASGAIVSSLFPDQVRNQLYEDNEMKNNRKNASPGAEFIAMSASLDGSEPGRPNAHLYENTSVFFADIVGHPDDPAVARALEELRFHSKSVRLLGTYPQARKRGE